MRAESWEGNMEEQRESKHVKDTTSGRKEEGKDKGRMKLVKDTK